MSFFDLANKIEQSKRHLNFVYSICSNDIAKNPIIFKSIIKSRENGYLNTYSIILNSCLNENQKSFLEYLKNKFDIEDDIYKQVIGLEEVNPEIRSPQGYSKKDNFILLLHLATFRFFCTITETENDFIVNFAKSNFNFAILQDVATQTHGYLNNNYNFEEFNTFENKVVFEIETKYKLKFDS